MEKDAKNFLKKLLATPSPSGFETAIQQVWIDYVKSFADEVKTDMGGNVVAVLNPKAKFKVLLAGHCDEIGFMVKKIDSNGFLRVAKVGGISHKVAPGMKVTVLGCKKELTGVFGVNAEHHGGLGDKFSFDDLYIDCGAKSKEEMEKFVAIGDYAVYNTEPEFLLNNKLCARALDDKSGAFIVAEVIRRLHKEKLNVGVYSVSTVQEEIGAAGAFFAAAGIEPDMAIACDVTFATDYPGVNTSEHGEYSLEGGPVLAKGAPINKKINKMLEETAKKHKIKLQYELTISSTGTDADKMRFTRGGVPVALVSLPLRYMHSPVETCSLKDIEENITLLVEMIKSMTGKENLKPLEI